MRVERSDGIAERVKVEVVVAVDGAGDSIDEPGEHRVPSDKPDGSLVIAVGWG